MARGSAQRGSRNNKISNVRIVKEDEGQQAMRIDRMIAAVRESQSQIRVLVKDTAGPGNSGGASSGTYSFTDVRATQEFVRIATEYQSYKVAGMRFDIYDLNPNQPAFGFWGTWHGGGSQPAAADVSDLPDSAIVPPGSGKLSLYWYPSGDQERSWFDVTGGYQPNHGGMAWSLGTTPGTGKFNVIANVLVDFRARR